MANGYDLQCYSRIGDGAKVTGGQVAVTQITSIATGVICSSLTGVITTVSQTIAAAASQDIVVTNTLVKSTDVVNVCIKTHTSAGTFVATVATVVDGSFTIRLNNLHASAAGNNVLVLNFNVEKCEA